MRSRHSNGALGYTLKGAVFLDVFAESAALPGDFDSLNRQRSVFAALSLFVLAALLLLHIAFASFWGKPSAALAALLGASCAVRIVELLWLRGHVLGARASAVL